MIWIKLRSTVIKELSAKSVSISGYGVEFFTNWKENLSVYDLIFSATEINNPEFTNLLSQELILKDLIMIQESLIP